MKHQVRLHFGLNIDKAFEQASKMHQDEVIEISKDSYIAGYLDNQSKVDDSMNFPEDIYYSTFRYTKD